MKPSEALELHKSLCLKVGDFIELEVTGEVESMSKRGALRLHNSAHPNYVETTLSSLHVMEAGYVISKDRDEVTATVRGYFEAWANTKRGGYLWLALLGNGVTSRISVYHIVSFCRLGAPTLGE